MKTEREFGYEYAEWLHNEHQDGAAVVEVESMINGTVSIPDGDYTEMVRHGIKNPDARRYWDGFNSFFEIKSAASALGRIGGASKSEAKTRASRDNGKKGGRPRNNRTPRCHRDGTVSYWSVYRQSFVSRADGISDEELAAMNQDDRERVIAHIQPARKG